MASYTIFGTGNPSGVAGSGDTDEISVSMSFYALGVTGWRIGGIRIWIPAGAILGGGTKKAYLWTGSGITPTSILATADFTSFVAGAWNTVYFSAPVSLIAGKYYWTQVYLPSGGYGFKNSTFPSTPLLSVETGSLYAAGRSETTPGQGSYAAGPPGTAPNAQNTGVWHGVDVIVDDGTASGGPGSDDNVGIADHITTVRSGLPAVVNASATVTDILGAVTSDTAAFPVGGATAFHTTRRSLFDDRIQWGGVTNTGVLGPELAHEPTGPLTVGVDFNVLWPVRFVGCKIYKHPDLAGSIPVRLWDRLGSGGTPRELASITVTWVADTGGWRDIIFPAPFVGLAVDVDYMVSYYSPTADFALSPWVFFNWNAVHTPMVVPRFIYGVTDRGGGVYRGGTEQLMPNEHTATNYYIGPTVEWDSNEPLFKPDTGRTYLQQFVNGMPSTKFPIAIYNSDPPYIQPYADMGINTIIGAPGDAAHVTAMKAAGLDWYMAAGTDQDPLRLGIRAMAEDPVLAAQVKGYYVVDEPDQLHPFAPPNTVREWCNSLRIADSTRPIFIGMGRCTGINGTFWHQPQGSNMDTANALWRDWIALADIGSGDMYTLAADQDPDGVWGVWMYPVFVRRIKFLSEGRIPTWAVVEVTSQTPNRPFADDVRKAIWSCLIEGVTGLEMFGHRFASGTVTKDYAAMLNDPAMKETITALIIRINSLVDAIISPDTGKVTTWTSSNTTSGPRGGTYGVPMHFTTRTDGTYEYLFAMGIRPGSTTAAFTIPDWAGETLTVIDESRTIAVDGSGVLTDNFPADYTVHLYRKG